jgi:Ca2+-binding RTX toxin-like protein
MDYSVWGGGVWVNIDGSDNDGPFPCDDWIGCPVVTPHNVHIDVENVIGTNGNDKIIGNDLDNSFDGGDGNDTLEGKGGDDYLDAEAGTNQKDDGGNGNDICVGFNVNRVSCES